MEEYQAFADELKQIMMKVAVKLPPGSLKLIGIGGGSIIGYNEIKKALENYRIGKQVREQQAR